MNKIFCVDNSYIVVKYIFNPLDYFLDNYWVNINKISNVDFLDNGELNFCE